MSTRRCLVVALALSACAHAVPAPLALPPESDAATEPAPTTRVEALAWVIAGDPLARRPRSLPDGARDAAPFTDGLVDALDTIARAESTVLDAPSLLQPLERTRAGTEAVAVSRGYRLGLADELAARAALQELPLPLQVGALLTPLRPESDPPPFVRHPLTFLAPDGGLPDAVRHYGDRWVLEAWLDGPDIPLDPVLRALDDTAYDRLWDAPLGRLLRARAARDTADPSVGWAALQRATTLALQRAVADRDADQRAWAEVRSATAAELGVSDPIGALLDRATTGLTADAGTPRSAGAALLAITARRLAGPCPDAPCAGLDRVSTISRANVWSPELAPLVRAWRTLALHDAVDGMAVAHSTIRFPLALADLVDALVGTGAAAPRASLLQRNVADADAWSQLGELVGDATPKTWEALEPALRRVVHREATAARAIAFEADRPWLDRILARSSAPHP